ncbi:hypothetical protein NDU88_008560 [Pleurodeles waltl]|uniref:Uncharacterized protein n=1 Tax=Pleurodeles waltl TaxID=8319 RepID=A0AAV7PTG3_PLEWA|nr:hypothetical protein NDU88_008560 [Pleurodeles waltl]
MPGGCPWAENGLTVSTTGTAELMECGNKWCAKGTVRKEQNTRVLIRLIIERGVHRRNVKRSSLTFLPRQTAPSVMSNVVTLS